MRRIQRRALGALLAVVLVACAGKVVGPRPALPLPLFKPAQQTWLDAPDNDPDVLKLGRAALACPKHEYGFPGDCAPLRAWEAEEKLFRDGKADPTLVNMLEDPDPRARLIAVRHLENWGKVFRTSPALAGRVVAAAERERFAGSDLAARLGTVVAMIDVEGTGLLERVATLARKHPLYLVRSYLVKSLPEHNSTSTAVRRIVEGAINDPEWEVRLSSAGAYHAVEAGTSESCAFWSTNLTHRDRQVVGYCALGLSQDRCARYHDRLLGTLERSDALTAPFSLMAYALRSFCKGSAATGVQRSKATALARRIVETGADFAGCSPDRMREQALDAVVVCDPSSAKDYVGRFRNDSNPDLQQHAKELWKRL
jgi:hypothetical protein